MICGIFNAAAQNLEPGMGAWHPAVGSVPWAVQGWGAEGWGGGRGWLCHWCWPLPAPA